MKRYSNLAFALTTTVLLCGTATMAQDAKESKEQRESRNKIRQYDELILRKKGEKDTKITIEIKDGDVFVDGKPLDEFENDNISVRRSKTGRVLSVSPFRNGGAQTYNFNEDQARAGGARTFLGVVTEEAPGGARINSVSKESPAEKAGLKEKDIITKIAGEKVQDEKDVSRIIRSRKPDEEVKITVLRDGKEMVINAKLGKTSDAQAYQFGGPLEFKMEDLGELIPRNFEFSPGAPYGMFNAPRGPRLGIKVQDTETGNGVKVLEVADESAAEKAGIKEDDIITEFNGKKVNSAEELAKETAAAAKDKIKIPVKLLRDGKTMNLDVAFPKKLKTANL
jgi:serine protease Do